MSDSFNLSNPLYAHLKPVQTQFDRAKKLAEQKKFQESLDAYAGCLTIAARDKLALPVRFLASVLINSGFCQMDLKNPKLAYEFYMDAEKLLQKDTDHITRMCQRYDIQLMMTASEDLRPILGELYDSMALGLDSLDKPDKGLPYYQKSLAISETLNNPAGSSLTYRYMAIGHQRRQRWTELQETAAKMLKSSQQAHDLNSELAAQRFLAQAYANQGQIQNMLREMEKVVALAQRLNDPGLAKDKELLAFARQAASKAPAPVKPAANNPKSAPPSMPKLSTKPVPRESYRQHPVVKMFEKVTVQVMTERGAPQPTFIIHTGLLDETAQLLRDFQLNILPLSIPMLRKMPLPADAVVPKQGTLMLEWSVDDINPQMIACEQVVPDNLLASLSAANKASRSITVLLESKGGIFSKSRTLPVPGVWNAYSLDWTGNLGISTYLRISSKSPDKRPIKTVMEALRKQVEMEGPITGVYTEIGLIHRLLDEFPQAIACYEKEIQVSRQSSGLPGVGAIRALNNLGVVYKKMGELDIARQCFRAALELHPNYFECLISLSGIADMENYQTAVEILARAFRIRPSDPIWSGIMQNFSQGSGIPAPRLFEMVKEMSQYIDFSMRQPVNPNVFNIPGID